MSLEDLVYELKNEIHKLQDSVWELKEENKLLAEATVKLREEMLKRTSFSSSWDILYK